VLNDMSSLYADIGGKGSVLAAQMAVDDFGGKVLGAPIEIVSGDHQNKPDIGAGIARKWIDSDHVDAIVDVPTSSVALAIQQVTREKKRLFVGPGFFRPDRQGLLTSRNPMDLRHLRARPRHRRRSGEAGWRFLVLHHCRLRLWTRVGARDTGKAVKAAGGKVVGAVRAPLNTSDFSSFLLQAQASKAKVIGLANAGGDIINSIKQASEFGIVFSGQKLAGFLVFLTDVHSLGLKTAQGLTLTSAWYWDKDDASRAFAKRFMARNPNAQSILFRQARHSVPMCRSNKQCIVPGLRQQPT
jgi:branched-chain amino acid transport system substrate-binding protein